MQSPRNQRLLHEAAERIKVRAGAHGEAFTEVFTEAVTLSQPGVPGQPQPQPQLLDFNITKPHLMEAFESVLRSHQLQLSKADAARLPMHERGLLLVLQQALDSIQLRRAGPINYRVRGKGIMAPHYNPAPVIVALTGGTSRSPIVCRAVRALVRDFGIDGVLYVPAAADAAVVVSEGEEEEPDEDETETEEDAEDVGGREWQQDAVSLGAGVMAGLLAAGSRVDGPAALLRVKSGYHQPCGVAVAVESSSSAVTAQQLVTRECMLPYHTTLAYL
jgi:hypothetical protein